MIEGRLEVIYQLAQRRHGRAATKHKTTLVTKAKRAKQETQRRGLWKRCAEEKSKTDFPSALGNPAQNAGFPLSHSYGGGDLEKISALIEAGKLHPVIERVFPLEEIAEAHRVSESGHVRGKLVIQVP